MKIKDADTIKDVITKNEKVFTLAIDLITDTLKKIPIPKTIKVGLKKKECRPLEHISFAELELIENIKGDKDYFSTVISVMLGIDMKKVLKLRFIPTMRYFISVVGDLKKCADKFAKLDIPMTAEEKSAMYNTRSLGMYDIVSTFCKVMPQYKLEEAKQLQWTVIYVELEKNKAKIMTERNMAKIQNQKKR